MPTSALLESVLSSSGVCHLSIYTNPYTQQRADDLSLRFVAFAVNSCGDVYCEETCKLLLYKEINANAFTRKSHQVNGNIYLCAYLFVQTLHVEFIYFGLEQINATEAVRSVGTFFPLMSGEDCSSGPPICNVKIMTLLPQHFKNPLSSGATFIVTISHLALELWGPWCEWRSAFSSFPHPPPRSSRTWIKHAFAAPSGDRSSESGSLPRRWTRERLPGFSECNTTLLLWVVSQLRVLPRQGRTGAFTHRTSDAFPRHFLHYSSKNTSLDLWWPLFRISQFWSKLYLQYIRAFNFVKQVYIHVMIYCWKI